MNQNADQQAAPAATFGGAIAMSGESGRLNVTAGSVAAWHIQIKTNDPTKINVLVRVNITYEPGAPDWEVKLSDKTGALYESAALGEPIVKLPLDSRPRDLVLSAEAPRGARIDDVIMITVEAFPEGNASACSKMEFSAYAIQSTLILKTSIGHEMNVADGVASKAKSAKDLGNSIGIFAILVPEKLDGYVIVEGMNTDLVRETVRGVRKSKGLVEGETKFSEIEHFLTPKPLVSGIMEGDVVELVAGPFKGEKARVQKIDESKEEITVELFEALVPIPVTVRGDHVRVLEKEK